MNSPVHSQAAKASVAPAYLHPGQMITSSTPMRMTTILGSCVAVCMWDPITRVGGMTHYLLAEPQARDTNNPRYGTSAIPLLIEEMRRKGAHVPSIQAKVFGGACILRVLQNSLGDKNVAVARDLLHRAGIRITHEETLGFASRKVTFDTATGATTLQTVESKSGI